jgi:hypothetical protein
MSRGLDEERPVPAWASAIEGQGVDERTAERLVARLAELETDALAFCRLLERWAAGKAEPPTAGARTRSLRVAAERVETALEALDAPLSRYLLELETGTAEGRSWFGEVGRAELVDWSPVLARAGVVASPDRVAGAYLELAVLIRALAGLSAAVEFGASPDGASLWAGLFDLRENLFGRVQGDFQALAA